VAAFVPGLPKLTFRSDSQSLVNEGDRAIAEDRRVREEFGLDDRIVVAIETSHQRGIFNRNTLRLVKELTDAVCKLPGVRQTDVISLSTERNGLVFLSGNRYPYFVDSALNSDKSIARLRRDLLIRPPDRQDNPMPAYVVSERATNLRSTSYARSFWRARAKSRKSPRFREFCTRPIDQSIRKSFYNTALPNARECGVLHSWCKTYHFARTGCGKLRETTPYVRDAALKMK
jgi:hypothetical protein